MTVRPPIDVRFLREQTFGDRTLEAELLSLFIEQASGLRPKLRGDGQALSARDLLEALHKLKGSARAIGAEPLALSLERMEAHCLLAASEPTSPSPDALKALRASLDEACSFAASLLPANSGAGLAKRPESR